MKTTFTRRAAMIIGLGALATLATHPLWAQKRARSAREMGAGEVNSRVEIMDAMSASKVARGLGFNLKFTDEWQFTRAREAGATEARMQFDWPSVERAPGQLKLTSAMARALDLCAQNGLEPLIIAAYGPAAKPLGELTVSSDVPAGSTQIPVSGAILPRVNPPSCHILGADGQQIVAEGRWAYYGALIDGVDAQNGTLQLAAKTNRALARGTILRVNQLLYPSVATSSAADPSLVAYGRYARFLAGEIAARGLVGKVELWNEPPWIHDRWDARGGFYDAAPRGISAQSPNPGMLDEFLNGEAPPRGVSFVWGGSHKSGGRGLGARRGSLTASQLQNVSADALHPYGDSPEIHAWNPQAMREGKSGEGLALVGTNVGSNFKILRQNQLAARRRGDLAPRIIASEIGHLGGDETQKTRYDLRAFLTYLSLGLDRIDFFQLADKPGKFGFIDAQSQQPLPAFRAFRDLMAEINSLPTAPVGAGAPAPAPAIASYSGQFPLEVVPIAARDRWLMVSYQRTYARAGQKWDDVPSPASARVSLQVPAGFQVQKVWDLVSGAAVDFDLGRGGVSYAVSDDPVAVEMAAG